tara:strand:+ start:3036 stop:3788 length:753 start_codon:yes stop_codon:yes gene_type:complete
MGFDIMNILTFGAKGKAEEAEREANRLERESRDEMNRLRDVYANLDLSNPFAGMQNAFAGMENQFAGMQNQFVGMENTMEDLTINQQQADFQAQQFAQSQSNILGGLRAAAGGSGIASLAQSLAREGQLASQQASASIGAQEAQNEMAAAKRAGQIQEMQAEAAQFVDLQQRQGAAEADRLIRQGQQVTDMAIAAGEQAAQMREADRAATMLGMSQQETAAYGDQSLAAAQASADARAGVFNNISNFLFG